MDPRRLVGLPAGLRISPGEFTTDRLLPPGVTPLWKQRFYSPSSTPPPPHVASEPEIAHYHNKLEFPTGNPEPHFDPVLSTCKIVCKHLNKAYLGLEDRAAVFKSIVEPAPKFQNDKITTDQEDGVMDALRRGMQRVGLGETRGQVEPEIDIDEDEYTIPLDGDHREHARTLMLKMLSKGIGAMHRDKIQRVNEMINDCMLTSWDEVVGIVLWNLSRKFFFST